MEDIYLKLNIQGEKYQTLRDAVTKLDMLGRLIGCVDVAERLNGKSEEVSAAEGMPHAVKLISDILSDVRSASFSYNEHRCNLTTEHYGDSKSEHERLIILSVYSGLKDIYNNPELDAARGVASVRSEGMGKMLEADMIRIFEIPAPDNHGKLQTLAMAVCAHLHERTDSNIASAILPKLIKWASAPETLDTQNLALTHSNLEDYCKAIGGMEARSETRSEALGIVLKDLLDARKDQFDPVTCRHIGQPQYDEASRVLNERIQAVTYALSELPPQQGQNAVAQLKRLTTLVMDQDPIITEPEFAVKALVRCEAYGSGRGDQELAQLLKRVKSELPEEYTEAQNVRRSRK